MNSITSVASGLLASLLLSLGFSRLAAKFDRLNQDTSMHSVNPDDLRSSSFCVSPCRWQEV